MTDSRTFVVEPLGKQDTHFPTHLKAVPGNALRDSLGTHEASVVWLSEVINSLPPRPFSTASGCPATAFQTLLPEKNENTESRSGRKFGAEALTFATSHIKFKVNEHGHAARPAISN